MGGNRKSQRGVSLSGLLTAAVVIGIVVMLALKLAPSVVEYFQIVQSVKGVAKDPATRDATVADIRKAYANRAMIERISDVTPEDLDISKDGNDVVISFAYSKRIPLVANVSLLIDFTGSSSTK